MILGYLETIESPALSYVDASRGVQLFSLMTGLNIIQFLLSNKSVLFINFSTWWEPE